MNGKGAPAALYLRPREQARQVARFAPRLVHEEMFERRQSLNGAKPGAADGGGGAAGNAEQARQPVGCEADHQIVQPAPALITREQRRVAKVEPQRSEEQTSELQSLMRISYAVFCLKKQKTKKDYSVT